MKRLTLACCFAAVVMMSGCGSSADSILKKQIVLMNDMADAIENDASKEEIDKLKERGDALDKKLKALNLSAEEQRKLRERHEEEMNEAMAHLKKAMVNRMASEMKKGLSGMPQFGGSQD